VKRSLLVIALTRGAFLGAFLGASIPVQADDPSGDPSASLGELETRAARIARNVAFRLDDARQTRNAQQATCLDRTLSEVHALARQIAHKRAQVRADPREAPLARAVTTRYAERLDALRRRGRVCVGETAYPETRTVVEASCDPCVREDPTRLPPVRTAWLPLTPR